MNIEVLRQFIMDKCGDQRRESFLKAVNLVADRKAITIIETGTIRNANLADGASTLVWSQLAQLTHSGFFSVDNCQSHIETSKKVLGPLTEFCQYCCVDSVMFLSCFATPIHVLYLDSYDYSPDNPLPAQIHQLAELGAAYGKLSADALILLDDCNIPHGGKAGLVDPFLKERGWKLIHDQYQKLFTR